MPAMNKDVRTRLFVGGEWVPPAGPDSISVIDSTTEAIIGAVPEGTIEDVDRAVLAARQAFPGWSSTARGADRTPGPGQRRTGGVPASRRWPT